MTSFAAPPADPTAVVGRRIGAWAIDLLIAYFFISLLMGLFGVDGGRKDFETTAQARTYCDRWGDTHDGLCIPGPYQGSGSGYDASAAAIDHPERVLLAVVVHLLLFGLLQGLTGSSTGKRLTGLVVVDASGQPVGIDRSMARTGLWVVDGIVCGLPVVGGLLLLLAPGHQRLGDRVAGTYVVLRAHAGQPVRPVTSPPLGHPQLPPAQGWVPPPPGGAPEPRGPLPGWAPPPPGSTWTPLPPASPAPRSTPAEDLRAPTTDGPHWDEVRDTYITYHRDRSVWLEWDERVREWKPIDQ